MLYPEPGGGIRIGGPRSRSEAYSQWAFSIAFLEREEPPKGFVGGPWMR
jgi:hypothetical protein